MRMSQTQNIKPRSKNNDTNTDISFIHISSTRKTAVSTNQNTDEWISSDSIVDAEEMC